MGAWAWLGRPLRMGSGQTARPDWTGAGPEWAASGVGWEREAVLYSVEEMFPRRDGFLNVLLCPIVTISPAADLSLCQLQLDDGLGSKLLSILVE